MVGPTYQNCSTPWTRIIAISDRAVFSLGENSAPCSRRAPLSNSTNSVRMPGGGKYGFVMSSSLGLSAWKPGRRERRTSVVLSHRHGIDAGGNGTEPAQPPRVTSLLG